jgi:hypothetical protein
MQKELVATPHIQKLTEYNHEFKVKCKTIKVLEKVASIGYTKIS